MFRSIEPKKQADLISAYVKTSGGVPKRTQVLELVAQLNGAPNWNVFQGTKETPTEAQQALAQLMTTQPALAEPVASRLIFEHLQGVLTSNMSGAEALSAAQVALADLQLVAKALESQAWQAMGFNRIARDIPIDFIPLTLSTALFDETSWEYEGEQLEDELLDEIRAHGIVSQMEVLFPRSDRYGVPDEATFMGGREWLWGEGFCVLRDLCIAGEDSGDDSMTQGTLTVYLPPHLVAQMPE